MSCSRCGTTFCLRDETGTAPVELVAIAFAFILLLWLGYGAVRVVAVRGDVDAAAWAAARAATGSYTPAAGSRQAQHVATSMLASDQSQRCQSINVVTSGSWSPGGQVTVTVDCQVALAEVTGVGFGSTRTFRSTATGAIEPIRGGR